MPNNALQAGKIIIVALLLQRRDLVVEAAMRSQMPSPTVENQSRSRSFLVNVPKSQIQLLISTPGAASQPVADWPPLGVKKAQPGLLYSSTTSK